MRAAGALSRVAGRGGGTTLPGKLLWKLDPGAIDRLAQRLPDGSVLVSATNGKTTTSAMVAEILRPRMRLAHNNSGANLVSGIASTLLRARGAQLGLFEVDEAALPEIARRVKPKALLLGNLFRDQLDRYGELEIVAGRWRSAIEQLRGAMLVVNGDDPQVGDLATVHGNAVVFGVDDPSHARPALQHAADSKYCLRCGTPYDYAAAYVGHLGDYRCPSCGHHRPQLDVRATSITLDGLDGSTFHLESPQGAARDPSRAAGSLQRLQRTRRRGTDARAGRAARRRRRGARALLRRVRALRADPDRRPAAADALDQEPGGCERGRAHDRRRRRAERRRGCAERRDRRRTRRVVDLGRRLRAAGRRARPPRRDRRPRRGARAPLCVRRASIATASRSFPIWRRRSTAGSS